MAVLAAAKLGLLLTMGLRGAPAPVPVAAVTATPPAAVQNVAQAQGQISGQMSGPAPVVRASILDDAPAHAQAAAAAPAAPDKKAIPPAQQPESVLSVQVLRQRAEALDRQEQALKTLEADLNARLASLKELESSLKGLLDEAKSVKDEKMRHLIDMYTNMKPKQAASVLETLDEGVAVKILSGMKGRQAGEILTFVAAKKAAKLSEDLTKFQAGKDLPERP